MPGCSHTCTPEKKPRRNGASFCAIVQLTGGAGAGRCRLANEKLQDTVGAVFPTKFFDVHLRAQYMVWRGLRFFEPVGFEFEGLTVLGNHPLGLLRDAVGHIRIDLNRDPHLGLWQDRQVLEDLLGDPARVPAGAVRVQLNGREEAFG